MICDQYIVLLVNASAEEREACRQFLQQDGQTVYQIQAVDCGEAALRYCEQMLPDVMVLGNPLSASDGLAWLDALHGPGERLVPIVVLLESVDQAIALQLMQRGVQDSLLKSELTAEKLCYAVKVAILRSHLQRQIEKQREQQRLVGAIALRIRQSLNLQTVLTATVSEVRQFLQADRVLVYQFKPDFSGVIQAEALVEGYSSTLQVQIEDVCFQQRGVQRYLDGHAWIMNDVHQAGLTKCHLQMLEQFQVKANLVVPILLSDRPSSVLWGLLVAHQCSAPRIWSADDLELLDQLAVQIAIAIQQAELYQQVMQDVAVRKQSEMSLQQVNQELEVRVERQTEELRSSEAVLRAIFNQAAVGIVQVALNGRLLKVNQKFCDILGYSCDELLGKMPADLMPTTELDESQAYVQRITSGEIETYVQEKQYLRRDGGLIWVRVTVSLVRDPLGLPDYLITVVEDITNRREAEQALRESEENLRRHESHLITAQRIAHVGSWEYDLASQNIIWSDETFRILGYEPGQLELSFAVLLRHVVPDEQDAVRRSLDWAIAHQQPLSIDLHCLRRDGSEGYLQARVELVLSPIGAVTGFLGTLLDVTELKQTEEQLQKTRNFLQNIIDHLPVSVFVKDAQAEQFGIFRIWNKACEQMFGCLAEQVLGHTSYDFLTEERARLFHQRDISLIERGVIEDIPEDVIETVKLGKRILHTVTVPVYNNSHEPEYIIGISEDITVRKQTETTMRNLQERLEFLLASTPGVIYSRKMMGSHQVTYMSDASRHWFGYDAGDYLAEPNFWVDRLHPEDRHSMLEMLQLLPEQEEQDYEYRFLHKDGSYRWVYDQVKLVRDEQENPVEVIGYWIDITERKQAELAQRQQIEQELLMAGITQRIRESLELSTILNTTVAEVQQLLQADRVLIYRIAEDGSGTAIAEVVMPGYIGIVDHLFPSETFPPGCHQRYLNGYVYVLPDRDLADIPACLVALMKEFQIHAELVAPIVQHNTLWGLLIAHQCDAPRQWQPWEGNLMRQVANQLAIAIQQSELYTQLQQELSDRKQAEARLHQINEQLALANSELASATRHKDDFLANMSHELRTPLNAILGMSEGLLEEVCGSLSDRQRKAISTIAKSGQHLLDLINDILDLAKIEAGKLELNIVEVSIKAVCSSSLAFVKPMAIKKNIQLNALVEPDIGDIQVDERRFQQVLINLLSNAVKFTPEGGNVTLEVHVASPNYHDLSISSENEKSDEKMSGAINSGSINQNEVELLEFSVIDDGIGIAQTSMVRLFQPFVQVDSALNRQYAGTGLGLALVRRIMELHSGTVYVQSEVGFGSQFTVRLPRHQPLSVPLKRSMNSDVNVNLAEPKSAHSLMKDSSQPPLVLLVEDNEANIDTFSEYLESQGFHLLIAHDGWEAVSMARSYCPHLILMDIQLPGMDGLEAICQIRTEPPLATVPIIALTALAMADDRQKCLDAGADDYLTKPVGLRQLVDTIRKFLYKRT